ncbi:hypothetical protein TVAG_145580 [Trichomonas vaginalis G3]|uniref:DUF3447 domain-containing protein n=1 Tax=Trichomonas vaginalis (strain ATCC PRA-98 / G3) TaxID=412133 RepID=A2EFS7_TRIV3|nr:spectrin binding [Trichomonas vaginalis G3]EAY08478.1 hypothetical protein TVAG_145580 [Trichomonas vaginalis G3]KAI5537765.1 spectrin binding [Trichomonas vaginalis G3]|eukprot:XP_001320701.1 hypothetical protein [Trichomonas vaginalis G3]
MEKFQDCADLYDTLYTLSVEQDIESLFQKIQDILIEKHKIPTSYIIKSLSNASLYHEIALPVYWELAKKIYEINTPFLKPSDFSSRFKALLCKQYNFGWTIHSYKNLEIEEILHPFKDNEIMQSIMSGDIEEFRKLARCENFDINAHFALSKYVQRNLIEYCSYYGSQKIFKFLISNGAKITEKCMELSFLGRNKDILTEIINASGFQFNNNCLINSIISHNIDLVIFLKNNTDLTYDIKYLYQYNNYRLFFIDIDKNKNDYYYLSRLFTISPYFFLTELVDYIYNMFFEHCNGYPFDINLINDESLSHKNIIHSAAECNNLEIVKMLLDLGVDIDLCDDDGWSPLIYAVYYNSYEIVDFLNSRGCNRNIKNSNNETADDFAKYLSNKETLEVLKKHPRND